MTQSPVAIVTAASQGMGRACAEELAGQGYRVSLLARTERIRELADTLGGIATIGSVTEADDLARLVGVTVERFGRIDAVVNNTGHPAKGDLLEIADEDWHTGLDLLLLNVVRMSRLVVPVMRGQGSGALVNISTFGAEEPSLQYPVSSAIRGALAGFTKLFAERYGPAGIRMNNLLPGFIDSYTVDDATKNDIPLGRAGRVAEVAKTAAFLVSSAAGYITGQSVRVDGGLSRSL